MRRLRLRCPIRFDERSSPLLGVAVFKSALIFRFVDYPIPSDTRNGCMLDVSLPSHPVGAVASSNHVSLTTRAVRGTPRARAQLQADKPSSRRRPHSPSSHCSKITAREHFRNRSNRASIDRPRGACQNRPHETRPQRSLPLWQRQKVQALLSRPRGRNSGRPDRSSLAPSTRSH